MDEEDTSLILKKFEQTDLELIKNALENNNGLIYFD